MNDQPVLNTPSVLSQIEKATQKIGFQMASDPLTGSLLRTLAASKPAGRFLELGTGTGMATAWLLDGMDKDSRLITIEQDAAVASIAREYLGHDRRLSICVEDAAASLLSLKPSSFDLIFADTWAGKYTHLEEALRLLKPAGLYVIDDMLPQPNWPQDHGPKVRALIAELENRRDLILTKMNWSTGIVIAAKIGA